VPLPVIHIFFTWSTPHIFHYYTIGISYQIVIAIHLFNTIIWYFSIQRDVVQILRYLQFQPVPCINNYFASRSVRPQRLKICLCGINPTENVLFLCFHWFYDCLQNLRVIFDMAWSLPFYWTNIFSNIKLLEKVIHQSSTNDINFSVLKLKKKNKLRSRSMLKPCTKFINGIAQVQWLRKEGPCKQLFF
jgi:hypothetical protein